LNNEDIVVQNNCIEDVPVAAFGDIVAHGDNRGASIRNNQICRVNTVLEVLAIETLDVEVDFSSNTVISGGRIQLRGRGGARLEGLSITNNTFEDVLLRATDTNGLIIQGNEFRTTSNSYSIASASPRAHGQERNVTDPTVIALRGGTGNFINDNTIAGAEIGIHISNSNTVIENMSIADNILIDQVGRSILIGDIDTIDASSATRADFRGVQATGNQVVTDQLIAEGVAIELGRGASFLDGCVESNTIGILIHGYAADPLDPKARISGNNVVSSGLSLAVARPYSLGIELADNQVTGGVAENLLENNPGAQAPTTGATGCQN